MPTGNGKSDAVMLNFMMLECRMDMARFISTDQPELNFCVSPVSPAKRRCGK